MSNASIIKRVESMEALASLLVKEATSIREELLRSEGGKPPATRKGLSDEEIAKIRAKFRKTQFKRALIQ